VAAAACSLCISGLLGFMQHACTIAPAGCLAALEQMRLGCAQEVQEEVCQVEEEAGVEQRGTGGTQLEAVQWACPRPPVKCHQICKPSRPVSYCNVGLVVLVVHFQQESWQG
jgi:hypothetical protein